jgi:hypothetical protein
MNPRNTPPQGRYTVRRAGSEVVIPRTHGDHRSGGRGASPWHLPIYPWGGILSKSPGQGRGSSRRVAKGGYRDKSRVFDCPLDRQESR